MEFRLPHFFAEYGPFQPERHHQPLALRTCHDPHPCYRQLRQLVHPRRLHSAARRLKPPSVTKRRHELDEVIKLAEEHDGVLALPAPVPCRQRRASSSTPSAGPPKRRSHKGTCLGRHQAIAEAYLAATVTHAPRTDASQHLLPVHENVSVSGRRALPLHPATCHHSPGGCTPETMPDVLEKLPPPPTMHHHGPAPPRSPHARRAKPHSNRP